MKFTYSIAILCILGVLPACSDSGGEELICDTDSCAGLPHKSTSPIAALPQYRPVQQVRWLDQGWSEDVSGWSHHVTQGTALPLPYEWFLALEQPALDPAARSLFHDQGYMNRFGFIPSRTGDPLPVGFAKTEGYTDPNSGQVFNAVGFTCAACHTGQLEYRGTSVRIDGGPSMVNLGAFRTNLAVALTTTAQIPERFDRFAARLIPAGAPPEYKIGLQQAISTVAAKIKGFSELTASLEAGQVNKSIEEGFARLDAFGRIATELFFSGLLASGADPADVVANYASVAAPVNYPHIWNSPWFDWQQYTGSIVQPMMRNFTEALGVGAGLNLLGEGDNFMASTVEVDNLYEIEQELSGSPPFREQKFSGLTAPKWPEDVLGTINTTLASQGESLYNELCQGCHLPATNTPEFWNEEHWTAPNGAGRRYLKTTVVDLAVIGTDDATAVDMIERKIKMPATLGGETVSLGEALLSSEEMIAKRYSDLGIVDLVETEEKDGHREGLVRTPAGYRARPLNGVWATAPFLHNGSVPSLYALLSPVRHRPRTFFLGNRQFDPTNVGYRTNPIRGGFRLDTSIRGNRNTGHEFDNAQRPGVIGRLLSRAERRALVEYLKTL